MYKNIISKKKQFKKKNLYTWFEWPICCSVNTTLYAHVECWCYSSVCVSSNNLNFDGDLPLHLFGGRGGGGKVPLPPNFNWWKPILNGSFWGTGIFQNYNYNFWTEIPFYRFFLPFWSAVARYAEYSSIFISDDQAIFLL